MDIKAYAKINLGLYVIGKRADGFHNIETIFYHINLFDEVQLSTGNNIIISCSNPKIPTDNNNLCWKAVELLQKELGVTNGAKIFIKKNIPIGAGLGGGSSDAAAILRHLPKLWNMKTEPSQLEKLALQLGSDVPFFLSDSSAYAEGRGELLQEITLTLPYWIVLINPNIHVSTPWAYKILSEQRNNVFPVRQRLFDKFLYAPIQTIIDSKNDFEGVVLNEFPQIKKIKLQLAELGAVLSLMSGSGSSVFGLFENEHSAQAAIEFFKKEYFIHLTEPYFSPLP
ncbi:MAG: 4-(cytidine 5'-diphospho)-2-C-methyl-D-erythritol kinase [Bacteroidota bacterium]|nr:4-(cytidine 5'-diphospho)-2-C-methyl-D-erythritol kinase [Bacteroidota bacterium]